MMASLTLSRIAGQLEAAFEGPDRPINGVCIDSRKAGSGDLFVALPGARVDGHDFVTEAARQGAVAAIVERPVEAPLPQLRVASATRALSQLGQMNREASEARVIAITGSCGKTTVKNFCRQIFGGAGSTVATRGNYNNEIGVPLTLAMLDERTDYAVVEMGATRRGDIAHLCGLAEPAISTVLNAMEAHLEGFGSVADVADIKAEIYDRLGEQGAGVVNLDQPFADLWCARVTASGARLLTYDLHGEGDLSVSDVREQGLEGTRFNLHLKREQREVHIALPGTHSVSNALAAAALACAAGVDIDSIVAGLEQTAAEPGRLQAERLSNGRTLIDDSYNANPGSVRAAIDLLAATPGRSALILGEMLELGGESARLHAEMGERARERGIALFVGVGEGVRPAAEAFGEAGLWFASREALTAALPAALDDCGTILVKGSRGAAMEAVLEALRTAMGQRAC